MEWILNLEQLENFRKTKKLQPFRIKQIKQEIFKNSNINFEDMTTLSKELREQLNNSFYISSLTLKEQIDGEESTKISFTTKDNNIIETVILYHYHYNGDQKKLNRITLCVSTQKGCPIGCDFCITGKLGFAGNLTTEEILSQVLVANNIIKNKLGKKEDGTLHKVRNIVFMGMGEPLLNYENLKNSLFFMLEQNYLSLSKRHITISTSGLIPQIEKLVEDNLEVMLAISLHAPNQELRKKMMPVSQKYPLQDLMKTLDWYENKTKTRIFHEYILIKNLNDSENHAIQLSKLLKSKNCHVNLIPFNENPLTPNYQEPNPEKIENFKKVLERNGITSTLRNSLGRKEKGACGQLGWDKVSK
ncbi:23S rRNA (adenine(2503)-C(2))-methyltransferase RlmN [Candidatus Absconditicoccus praedator]|uniref:23S rRNA (adenine(2503)-C(2))-methyltransferase RlmN n=1 Tax=Candidatus Absconditicoccus praedator TaxID=2735562 RepID=UPI001E5CA377|nr:23S rRNA (adenine(2503)-C(2))-methyltransferase RlmN [Candidatus Absconditicoccus praedator]UFX83446.1 23S rRNA (adenine(2503)-C(2))-methyltransferase RlmN [Candidatus Absconditicoccus praedator]